MSEASQSRETIPPFQDNLQSSQYAQQMPYPVKKSTNPLFLILIILIVICFCLLVCGFITVLVYNKVKNNVIDATHMMQQRNANQSSSDNFGTSSLGNTTLNLNLPTGFPQDLPIYPGSTIDISIPTGTGGFSVTASSNSTPDQIINYYKSQLSSNGWTIIAGQSIFGSSITANKDSRQANIVALSSYTLKSGTNTTYVIEIGPR